jgi:hypothetical protein
MQQESSKMLRCMFHVLVLCCNVWFRATDTAKHATTAHGAVAPVQNSELQHQLALAKATLRGLAARHGQCICSIATHCLFCCLRHVRTYV